MQSNLPFFWARAAFGIVCSDKLSPIADLVPYLAVTSWASGGVVRDSSIYRPAAAKCSLRVSDGRVKPSSMYDRVWH